MKTNLHIDSIRASVFLPFLPCDWNIITQLQEIIQEGISSISTNNPLVIGESLYQPGSWTLASHSTNNRVIVQQQKVDYILANIKNQDNFDSVWHRFCEDTKRVMEIFMNLTNSNAYRLAIAPNYIYGDGSENWKDFIRKYFIKKTFKESELEGGDFSQLFRIKESFNDKYYRINYLSKFYASNQLIEKDGNGRIIERLNVEFDINTSADQEYSFNKDSMKSFFDNAKTFSEVFLTHYFD